MFKPLAVTLVVALLAAGCSDEPDRSKGKPRARYGPPRIVGRIQAPGLAELSGIAASRNKPGRFWAHNDSGGDPVLFCLTRTGASCGTTAIEGAEVVDWEDIAAFAGPHGSELYIADTGDNKRERESVTIYRLGEPRIGATTASARATVVKYPGAARDAEALIVEPSSGDLYIVTKEYTQAARVFVARAPFGPSATLDPVARLDLGGPLAAVTGADVSPNGDRIILSTYTGGFELSLPDGADFDEIWKERPERVRLGPHTQNEAVTYTRSRDIVSVSEGALSPIYLVEYLARP